MPCRCRERPHLDCQPLVERAFIPDDVRGFQFIRVAEVGYGSGLSAVDIAQTRTLLVLVERVAAGASLFEELLAIVGVSRVAPSAPLTCGEQKIAAASQMGTTEIKNLISLPFFTFILLLSRRLRA